MDRPKEPQILAAFPFRKHSYVSDYYNTEKTSRQPLRFFKIQGTSKIYTFFQIFGRKTRFCSGLARENLVYFQHMKFQSSIRKTDVCRRKLEVIGCRFH